MKKYFLALTIFFVCSDMAVSQDFVQHYNKGVGAYQEGDFKVFLAQIKKADSLRPNHRIILNRLATAYALNQMPEKAYQTLKYRIRFYAVDDFSDNEDLASLGDSLIKQLQQQVNELNIIKKTSTTVLELNIDQFHAEGIAFEERTERFYLTDIRNGWIYSVHKDGNNLKKELDLKDFGYWSAMGIKFDPIQENILWITTSVVENFSDFKDSLAGRAAVLKIDMENKNLVQAFELDGNHVFGDLVISKRGDVFISDSGNPVIYKISKEKNEITEFLSHSKWWNLQGLTLSGDEENLYISDYITGIYKIDLSSLEVAPISDQNEMLRGSDGIYFKDGKIIALQNGTAPKRVAVVNSEGKVTSKNDVEFPDNAIPELDEPTLGVLVNDDLFYIANSPWAHYKDGKPVFENWSPLIINRLSIK